MEAVPYFVKSAHTDMVELHHPAKEDFGKPVLINFAFRSGYCEEVMIMRFIPRLLF